jgi:hypothetical protein
VASVTLKRQAAVKDSGHCETALTKALCQAGSVPGSGVFGDALCGGDGTAGILGGTKPKGRWVQALLSPVPHSVEVACMSTQGQMILREEAVNDKGVSAFNAKVELYNCREWLKRIRGEVDAGLQRLDMLLKDVDITGPGQGCMGKEWASKPKRTPEPKGKKKMFIPKALGVGLGLGPNVCKDNGQPRRSKTTVVSMPASLGLVVGSSGHPNRPQGVGCSKENNIERGLALEASPSGYTAGDPSMEAGSTGLAVGRPGMGDSIRDGSTVLVSSSRLGLGRA